MPETKSTLKMHFGGEQVAAARKLLRITQRELAAATGLTQQTINKFEAGGNMRPETVEAVRDALVARGIIFTNGNAPGVQLRKPASDED